MPDRPHLTFHLPLFGQDRSVSVAIPDRGRPEMATQLVTAAHAITSLVVDETARRVRAAGQPITCAAGCSHCCQQLVSISRVEALALAERVGRMPPERQSVIRARFAESLRILRAAGLVAPAAPGQRPHLTVIPQELTGDQWDAFVHRYFDLHLYCPFLEDHRCSIYDHRPLICREYMVTTPVEHCAALDRDRIRTIDLPLGVSQRFYEAASAADPDSPGKTALVFSLEWAATEPPGSALDGRSILSYFQLLCLPG